MQVQHVKRFTIEGEEKTFQVAIVPPKSNVARHSNMFRRDGTQTIYHKPFTGALEFLDSAHPGCLLSSNFPELEGEMVDWVSSSPVGENEDFFDTVSETAFKMLAAIRYRLSEFERKALLVMGKEDLEACISSVGLPHVGYQALHRLI